VRRLWYNWKYAGKGVFCPVCEREYRAFVNSPIGDCPGCGATDRSRLMWLYLRDRRPDLVAESKVVLQIAPDRGLERRFRALGGIRYLSGDLHEPGVMVRLDLTHLDLPDTCFDTVICIHVLAHISNDRKAMREMRRVLRPGGVALVMTPLNDSLEFTHEDPWIIDPVARDRAFGEWDFVRKYGRDFVDRLIQAGFDVDQECPAETMDEDQRKKFGLWNARIFLCRRPVKKTGG
jgi:SAM-dependent methyltransferase